MNIFDLNLPPEDSENDKFPKLDAWFDFMNDQLQKIEEIHENGKINNLLIDNDIEPI
jgi:hypothetical protein